jgi:hypothetical protein
MKTIREAVEVMKQVGPTNIRKAASRTAGAVDIQVCRDGQWVTLLSGLNQSIADDVVRQATDRMLLG